MNVDLRPAEFPEKPILQHLMQLYLHDFSEFDGADVNELGLYEYIYLDAYWQEPERLPFLIRVDGKLAGFALVRQLAESCFDLAEFFIMRRYRGLGVGRLASTWLFDHLAGEWHVAQEETNGPSKIFWGKVIREYTAGEFRQGYRRTHDLTGPEQIFQSRIKRDL
jgi:predicted acetyltransferase